MLIDVPVDEGLWSVTKLLFFKLNMLYLDIYHLILIVTSIITSLILLVVLISLGKLMRWICWLNEPRRTILTFLIFSASLSHSSCRAICILGWYLVWKLFLSRFKFVRELLLNGQSGKGFVTGTNVNSRANDNFSNSTSPKKQIWCFAICVIVCHLWFDTFKALYTMRNRQTQSQ